jgi:hypothetical protein
MAREIFSNQAFVVVLAALAFAEWQWQNKGDIFLYLLICKPRLPNL